MVRAKREDILTAIVLDKYEELIGYKMDEFPITFNDFMNAIKKEKLFEDERTIRSKWDGLILDDIIILPRLVTNRYGKATISMRELLRACPNLREILKIPAHTTHTIHITQKLQNEQNLQNTQNGQKECEMQ